MATIDLDRARAFYRDVLGLSLTSEDEFALIFDANGTMLRIANVPQLARADYTVLGWRVDNIETAIQELGRKGVTFERYDFLSQDDRGVWTTPSGAKVAWFKDPDGNTLSLTQFE